ncbi:MAG: aminoacyl-tRNA hydrolase [Planctomycetes bacterium]|nr:aminoacyl-tRNA hydrolase [Planctomycetota bacterium]
MPISESPSGPTNALVVTAEICIPRDEFSWTFVRSSGPGGQNVNKVATKAQLRWGIAASPSLPDDVKGRFSTKYRRRITKGGEFVMSSQRYRDQSRNVEDCLEKLRQMIDSVAKPPVVRKKTKPSRASKERRLTEKRNRSARKQSRRPPREE